MNSTAPSPARTGFCPAHSPDLRYRFLHALNRWLETPGKDNASEPRGKLPAMSLGVGHQRPALFPSADALPLAVPQ